MKARWVELSAAQRQALFLPPFPIKSLIDDKSGLYCHFIRSFSVPSMKDFADKLGMFLSGLCAIQCAMLPILLSASAVVPGWAHFGHGWLWMSVIGGIALWSFTRGWQRHQDKKVVVYSVLGYLVLIIATMSEDQVPVLAESALFVVGGGLMVMAHWRNYRLLSCAKV